MKKQLFLAFAATAMLAGCSKSNSSEISAGDEIRAVASVLKVEVDAQSGTKAAVVDVTDLKALVLATANAADFKAPLYASGTMTFADANERTYDAAGFTGIRTLPTDQSNLYVLALYPNDNWAESTDKKNLLHAFTGTQDILYTKVMDTIARGKKEVAPLTFDHALTKIDITVKAENDADIIAWGKIQKIEVTKVLGTKSFTNEARVRILKEDPKLPGELTLAVGTGAPTAWPFYKTDGNTLFTAQTLALTKTAVTAATTMMGHFVATKADTDLEISVTSKPDKGVAVVTPVKVALPAAGSTQGNMYTVKLNFKTREIKATAAVTPWKAVAAIDKDVD